MKKYNALLKEVALREEATIGEMDDTSGEALFLSQMSRNGVKAPSHRKTTFAIAAIAAAVIAAIGMPFFIDLVFPDASVNPSVPKQEWVQVGPDDKRQFRLIDGTNVDFFPNSTGRLSQSIARKGEVTLENGRVGLSVPHTDDTDWKVLAGPYRIHVIGTRFEIAWEPTRRYLQVDVYEGTVWVTGPLIEKGHSVAQNRSLSANLETSRIQNAPIEPAVKTDDTVTQPPRPIEAEDVSVPKNDAHPISPLEKSGRGISAPEDNSDRSNISDKPIVHRAPGKPNSLRWLQHARTGNYEEILKALHTQGLDQMLREAAPGDWLTLGNAARRAGDFETARTVYQKLRGKYRSSRQSATATLYLGRMAFDQQQDYSTAAKWFNIYLREQNDGPLHREALGRLMESQYNAHMQNKAQKTADEYLNRYPNGPHAIKAREITGQ